jgi:hypothetical protein
MLSSAAMVMRLASQADSQAAQHDTTQDSQRAPASCLANRKVLHSATAYIDDAEQHGRAHQAEVRNQKNRKEERCSECAEIVEGQDMRHDVAEVITVANNAHQQRNFQADQNSDDNHHGVHQKLKPLGVGEGQKEQRRGETSNHAQQQLDPHKSVRKAAIDVARKGAADAHGKQVAADDGGKLKNAIAEQVAGERPRDELVDEPAGGDQQNRDEKQDSQGLVDGGRDDDANADGHGSDQNGERGVVLLHNLFPEVVGSYLVDDQKRPAKTQCRSPRKRGRSQTLFIWMPIYLPPV